MSDFGFSITSIGGVYTGRFPSAGTLAGCPAEHEPVSNGTKMMLWQPKYSRTGGSDVAAEWNQYMKSTIRQDLPQISNWVSYLNAGNYTSESTACTVAEFAFVDGAGEVIPDQALCLRAFAPNGANGNMAIFMAKKSVIDSQTTTYVTVSDIRQESQSQVLSYGVTCGRFLRGGKVWYTFGVCAYYGWQMTGELFTNDSYGIETLFGYHLQPGEDYSDEYGPAAEGGGYTDPTFDDTSDNIDWPTKPAGVSALGFVNIYKCDIGSLTMLGDTLFPDVAASTDIWTAITALSDSIWNSKLIDYVISIHMIPCNVSAGNLEDIKIGTRTLTGILARKVTEDYVDVPMGSVKVDEYYTNFADYQTRAKLFLPFYGFVEIKPEYWQSATLEVQYRFNVVDGSFVAMVKSTVNRHQVEMSSIIGQYSGCACIHCPTSGVSYASMFGGMVANAGGMAVGLAAGNPALAMTSALATAAQAGTGGGQMQHGNPYNASSSIMGQRRPYLLIERPVSHFSTLYEEENGMPLMAAKVLGACRGYTVADDMILDGIPCTSEEKEMIRQKLKDGIIIQ